MSSETVQIGSFVISKTLVDVVFPLLGTVVGGLIASMTAMCLENRKWKREKQGRLREQERQALSYALAWLTPIEVAVIRATGTASALQRLVIDEEEFRREYPNLLSLLPNDPPAHLQVLLPDNFYPRVCEIRRIVDEELHARALKPRNQQECFKLAMRLYSEIDLLRKELHARYLKTFE